MLLFARALVLAMKMHAVYPSAPPALVGATAIAAISAETADAPAPVLAAIAEHESGLEPRAVSWVSCGKRVDIVWTEIRKPPSGKRLACGLVQTIVSSPADCAKLLDATFAMRAGAAELAEHRRSRSCGGSLACALSSYAGGGKGILAWRRGDRTPATAFAELFERRARRLGMSS